MSILLMVVMSGFLTPVTESGTQFGAGGVITVEKELADILYRIDLPQSRIVPIASGTRKKGLNKIDLVPNSKMLLVTWFETGVGYSLDVMDFEGKVLKSMEGVGSAVFIDHAGRRMAFARKKYTFGERTESLGVVLYDFESDKEERILDTGLHIEWGNFDNSLYIGFGGEEAPGIRYDLSTKEVTEIVLGTGAFSPDGEYRWGFKDGEIKIFRRVSQEVVSEDFELLKSEEYGEPLYWMGGSLIMLPHLWGELEDRLLDVRTGKTLKAPGRILSITDDEQFVYICKPGLVLEKIAMKGLEVLYEGKSQGNEVTEAPQEKPKN